MEQRVGRVARMGSHHTRVHVHVLRPPPSAAAALGNELIVQRKWAIAKTSVGTSAPNPMQGLVGNETASSPADAPPESAPAKSERLRSLLQSWDVVGEANTDHCIVSTIHAPYSGFVAAITLIDSGGESLLLSGRPQLLVGIANRVSTDIEPQIEACANASGAEISTDSAECERAVRAIESWCTLERASAAAGVGASSSVRRAQITRRIDSAIQAAPPHLRSARSTIALRARRVATTQQCEAVERELDALLDSELPADEWLRAIAALDLPSGTSRKPNSSAGAVTIHALLLVRGQ